MDVIYQALACSHSTDRSRHRNVLRQQPHRLGLCKEHARYPRRLLAEGKVRLDLRRLGAADHNPRYTSRQRCEGLLKSVIIMINSSF